MEIIHGPKWKLLAYFMKNLPSISQETISKIEKQFRELGHCKEDEKAAAKGY